MSDVFLLASVLIAPTATSLGKYIHAATPYIPVRPMGEESSEALKADILTKHSSPLFDQEWVEHDDVSQDEHEVILNREIATHTTVIIQQNGDVILKAGEGCSAPIINALLKVLDSCVGPQPYVINELPSGGVWREHETTQEEHEYDFFEGDDEAAHTSVLHPDWI